MQENSGAVEECSYRERQSKCLIMDLFSRYRSGNSPAAMVATFPVLNAVTQCTHLSPLIRGDKFLDYQVAISRHITTQRAMIHERSRCVFEDYCRRYCYLTTNSDLTVKVGTGLAYSIQRLCWAEEQQFDSREATALLATLEPIEHPLHCVADTCLPGYKAART